MYALTPVFVTIAAVIAGALVGDIIEAPVKRIAGRWWKSALRQRRFRRPDCVDEVLWGL
jgi:hypothetical protein